jgi:2-dehydropantoate 2-reductase
MQTSQEVTIVGAGGIGCAVGYALRTAGLRVLFVDTRPQKVAWGKENGVHVDNLPARAADFELFDSWSPKPGSTIFLCTKCYDNRDVLARLPADVNLIPVQNGFDQSLEEHGHAVEGIASFISECHPDRTETRITRPGSLHVGFRMSISHRIDLDKVAEALAHSPLFRLRVVGDISPYKHTKLMYNAAIGPVAASAGIDNGQLLANPVARELFFNLLRENYAILSGAGIRLETIGPFHPKTVQRILANRPLARMLSWAFYPSLRGTYCSMHADLPTGKTEIDNYNGYLIRLAGDRACNWNRRVYELVKRLASERIAPRIEFLTQMAA